jgi:hypothetical protein
MPYPKVIGLDVSKSSVSYWILDTLPENPKRFSRTMPRQKLNADAEGRATLLSLDFDLAVCEPTGTYSRIWRHWLKEAGREVRMVGHKELANYRNGWGIQKTDKFDCLALAMYGVERATRPSSWLVERDYRLNDLVAILSHINEQKNGFQNNLRQKLVWQLPEWHDRPIRRPWGMPVPGLLKALAGTEVSAKWQKEIEASCGIGLLPETRSLGRILLAIEEEEIAAEQAIDAELSDPKYRPYLEAADKLEFSKSLRSAIIGAIFPFEQFLTDGRRRQARSKSANGKETKRDESLRSFKLACGMGLVFVQSGDYEGWTAGGDADTRRALWQSIGMAYIKEKGKINSGLIPPEETQFAEVKHKYDNQGLMKVARRWVEAYYKELIKYQW